MTRATRQPGTGVGSLLALGLPLPRGDRAAPEVTTDPPPPAAGSLLPQLRSLSIQGFNHPSPILSTPRRTQRLTSPKKTRRLPQEHQPLAHRVSLLVSLGRDAP